MNETVQKGFEEMVEWRRHLHRNPELSYKEKETAAFVAEKLNSFGIEVRTNLGGYGLIGTVRGALPGKAVALRADMDALPIREESGAEYASLRDGVMHACGHDGHTSALLGAARYFAERRDTLRGEVRLLFQASEEVCPGGAKPLIEHGALDGVDAVYGVHLWTPLPVGTVASVDGPMMASTDEFFIDITGRGGHGGMPHEAVDSIVAASALVMQLQTVVSRSVDPLMPAVVSIGTIHGGFAQNVVAEKTRITGTVRTFNEETRALIRRRIETMCRQVAEAYGAGAEVEYMVGYPALVNDEAETARFFRVAPAALPEHRVETAKPLMPAEDFAYYLRERPGCFMLVGAGNTEKGFVYPHHHPKFDFDESAMQASASLLIAMAESFLTEK
ncbi:M20 family metallopeptidase [Saccharibacillus sp. CPCC 101409]|uniref:M20 family metallopeptidase n=1 Tax=Saccharibacillus sp. CPCC 101409 TaxID=3058041 RepID=UPI0026726183|nr:M20 family metallopeptidase [Saccharibacillus sp. CPCC 101409]MDO3409361.1 M20 family metallopeptidase [Saccharibacillus sp. CPCC 101409]